MTSHDTSSPENDAIYRTIRGELQFELSLLNARVNWLVASQAFLFTPLTMGIRGPSMRDSLFFPLIPLLGVVLCVLVLLSILAAAWRSVEWRRKSRRGAYDGIGAAGRFDIVVPHTPAIPLMGLVGSVGVPVVIGATWLYLLIAPPSLPL
ncbi:hypothetical protein [Acuticoccus sp. I52.16.1]|uniref:hypothetical protein n=1 Tax=Acuticoccus sp. I52.16.1 TaxID=2928472 RepID=UPI001FD0D3BA|nr:hypothetical protein [Acuticoccus sp. I52.16.1]UOM32627.1 hypothetical protein MRB58_12115 [Acuticoccus sp. I52.16.1]